MNATNIKAAATNVAHGFAVREFKHFQKNTLQAFFSLEPPSGMILNDCLLLQKNGSRWVNLPAREYTKTDGEKSWMPLIGFTNEDARGRFQSAAFAAVDRYLAEEER